MQTPAFEETRPADYLLRHAASDLGKACKGLAVAELAVSPGDVILGLGCGPGADLPALAEAAGGAGRVIGIDHDPDAVRQAQDAILELVRVPDEALPPDLTVTGTISQHLLASPAKARAVLGWRAVVDLQVLRRAVAWHLRHPPGDASTDFSADDAALAAAL